MGKASNLVPLLILFAFIGVVAIIGYVAYTVVNDVSNQTKKKMEKKNITVSRDGMKVGVKSLTTEQLSDGTQGVLMKVWNSASWPAYKSRLGWGQPGAGSGASTASAQGKGEKRKGLSMSTSSQQNIKRT